MKEYRLKTSTTMIYDQLPINDLFGKLNDNTAPSVMDSKLLKDPFFFTLAKGD